MRKPLFIAAVVLVVIGTALTVSFASRPQAVTRPMKIAVREHAITDRVTDTGKKGDSPGDLLTWHNPIFNAANTKQVGHDQGDCLRISPKAGTWECRWLTY